MTDSHDEDRVWPSSPFVLADEHRCPSCFTVVSAPVCPGCGLTLTDPRAVRVLELGRQIVSAELSRQQLMDEIRLAHAASFSPQSDAAAPPPSPQVAAASVVDDGLGVLLAPLADPAPAMGAATVVSAPADPATLAAPGAGEPVVPVPAAASPAPATAEPGEPRVPAASLPAAPARPAAQATPAGPPAVPAAGASLAPAPRRRLTVPVLLLIVGVSLVGVAAVFFLLLAWFVAGIAVRALIIGGITLATIALASWLRRRGLTATAEGIGALGVVLLALDAWAVRANDLFGAGAGDAAVYTGVAALVVAVICRLWARVSHLRGPDLAASLALPAGLGFLVAGLTALPQAEAVTAGLLGAAAGGLVHALPSPWSSAQRGADGVVERAVLAVCGVGALVAAGVTAALLTGDAVPVVIWSSIGLVVLGVAHAWLARRPVAGGRLPAAALVSGVGSGVATAAAGLAGWQLALRNDLPVYTVLVAPVLAVLVAFAIDLARSRRGTPAWLPAAVVSAVVAGLSTVVVLLDWGMQAATAIRLSWTLWHTDAFAAPALAPEASLLAVIAAVVIAGLLLAAPSLARPVLREVAPLVAAALLLVAAARTAVPAVLVGTAVALVIGAVTAAALLRPRRGDRPGDTQVALPLGYLVAGGIAAVTAYVGGMATPWLWLGGIAVAMAYPIALRIVLRPVGTAATAATVAPVAVAALSTLFAPSALAAVTGLSGEPGPVVAALLLWVALATLIAAIAVPLDQASRSALAVAAEVLAAFGLIGVTLASGVFWTNPVMTAIGEPALGIVRGGLLLAALVVVAFGATRVSGVPTVFAAALTAPVAAATAQDVLRALDVRGAEWAPLVLTAAGVAVPVVTAVTVLLRRTVDEAPPPPVSQWPADIAPAPPRPRPALRVFRRLAADLGAAVTVLVVVLPTPPEFAWAALTLVAFGLAAASVTRGWVGLAGDPADDGFATTREGMPLIDAPRRLLAWPVAIAAIAAWWSWLDAGTPDTVYTVESYALPAAVALVVFAALLVRLRRRAEASIALAGGLALGLWPSAVEGWISEPVRGVVVGLVAAAVALLLSFTPVRGIRPVAPVGAAVAVIGLGLVAVERAFEGPEWQVLWLVLLVAVAYASGWGAVQARPARVSSRLFALVVPPAALVAAVVAIVPLAGEPRIVAGTIIMLAALHLAAAGLDLLPLTATTRWISLVSACAVGLSGWYLGGAVEIEAVSLPVAAMCLIGAVLGMLRRRWSGAVWPAGEGAAWIVGLVLATAPSLVVAAEPVRVWAYIVLTLAAAAGVAALREPARALRSDAETPAVPRPAEADAADRGGPVPPGPSAAAATAAPAFVSYAPPAGAALPPGALAGPGFPAHPGAAAIPATAPPSAPAAGATPTSFPPPATPAPRAPLFGDVWTLRAPTVILLGLAAVVMGLRGMMWPGFEGDILAAIVAAVGAVAVAAVLTVRGATRARGAAVLAAAAMVLLVVVAFTHPQPDLVLTTVIAITGGALGVAGASVLGLRLGVALGGVLAVSGLVVAVVACSARLVAIPSGGLEPDLWAVAGAGIAAAIAFAALRATPSRTVGRVAGAGFAVASVLFAVTELRLLLLQDAGEELRTVAVMSALTAATVLGLAARRRLGLSLVIVAAIAGVGFGILALTAADVRPIELVTVPPAVGGIAYGVRTLRREPASRTWPTLGPWLALLTVPSLLHDFVGSDASVTGEGWFGEPALWRVVSLGIVALTMVVLGAIYRLQAPLVLGSAVLIVHGVAQLWPWISNAYVAVPWWLWLGLGGALLIFIAARYEKRMRALRTAFLAVASLR